MFIRTIQSKVQSWIKKGKVIIIYGARQTGKTTMVENILSIQENISVKYIDCDLIDSRLTLQSQNKELLQQYLGKNELVVIDEAQRVENIGINLKIIHKYLPQSQIIATGSSSFELANRINEPLTGRNIEFTLYPLSVGELNQKFDVVSIQSQLENILRYGLYPDIFGKPVDSIEKLLNKISNDYLYKDLLQYSEVRKSDTIYKFLQILAFCVGSELSYTELGVKVGINKNTAEKYLDLLEKCFVIKIVRPYKKNLIKEITKPFKVYFWDVGVRNSIIQAFKPLELRDDIGKLWENFCVIERIKKNSNADKNVQYYFWRTTDQKEIDLIELENDELRAFEFKWIETKTTKVPNDFIEAYPNTIFEVINNKNWWKHLL